MTELSPAAQAVYNAALQELDIEQDFTPKTAAATLRAMTDWFHSFDTAKDCYQKMHAVADELDELQNRIWDDQPQKPSQP